MRQSSVTITIEFQAIIKGCNPPFRIVDTKATF